MESGIVKQLKQELIIKDRLTLNLTIDLENYRNLVHRLNEEVSRETEYRKFWQNQVFDKTKKTETDILESLQYGYHQNFNN